jgi:hypothetical protein
MYCSFFCGGRKRMLDFRRVSTLQLENPYEVSAGRGYLAGFKGGTFNLRAKSLGLRAKFSI